MSRFVYTVSFDIYQTLIRHYLHFTWSHTNIKTCPCGNCPKKIANKNITPLATGASHANDRRNDREDYRRGPRPWPNDQAEPLPSRVATPSRQNGSDRERGGCEALCRAVDWHVPKAECQKSQQGDDTQDSHHIQFQAKATGFSIGYPRMNSRRQFMKCGAGIFPDRRLR